MKDLCLGFDLLFGTENMPVILGEPANAHDTMQGT